jgi:histidinol-phosphatase
MPDRMRAGVAALIASCRPAPVPDQAGTRHGALLVATGRTDAFLTAGVGPWDIAPMAVIVEEAGGRFSEVDGAVLYSNGVLHEQILHRLS